MNDTLQGGKTSAPARNQSLYQNLPIKLDFFVKSECKKENEAQAYHEIELHILRMP